MNNINNNNYSYNNNSDNNNKNNNKEYFDEIKIMINAPLITQINSHIISSFSDFSGIFLGRTKIIKKTKSIDSESLLQTKTLFILIENIIFIYDEKYNFEKIEELINKIEPTYPEYKIIGAFSAKAFSFPVISLKSQKFYFKLKEILLKNKNKIDNNNNNNKSISNSINNNIQNEENNIPILFGVFCTNIETNEIIYNSFQSKLFYFNENENLKKFVPIPFEIINLKETYYNMDINPISNKFIQYKYNNNCKNEVDKLNRGINHQLNHLKEEELKEIKELKNNIKKEIEIYLDLNKQIKNYNK